MRRLPKTNGPTHLGSWLHQAPKAAGLSTSHDPRRRPPVRVQRNKQTPSSAVRCIPTPQSCCPLSASRCVLTTPIAWASSSFRSLTRLLRSAALLAGRQLSALVCDVNAGRTTASMCSPPFLVVPLPFRVVPLPFLVAPRPFLVVPLPFLVVPLPFLVVPLPSLVVPRHFRVVPLTPPSLVGRPHKTPDSPRRCCYCRSRRSSPRAHRSC